MFYLRMQLCIIVGEDISNIGLWKYLLKHIDFPMAVNQNTKKWRKHNLAKTCLYFGVRFLQDVVREWEMGYNHEYHAKVMRIGQYVNSHAKLLKTYSWSSNLVICVLMRIGTDPFYAHTIKWSHGSK